MATLWRCGDAKHEASEMRELPGPSFPGQALTRALGFKTRALATVGRPRTGHREIAARRSYRTAPACRGLPTARPAVPRAPTPAVRARGSLGRSWPTGAQRIGRDTTLFHEPICQGLDCRQVVVRLLDAPALDPPFSKVTRYISSAKVGQEDRPSAVQ